MRLLAEDVLCVSTETNRPDVVSGPGNIESLAFCPALGGWLVLGWIGFGWDDQKSGCEAALLFSNRVVTAEPTTCIFERPDVRAIGTGIVIFIPDERDQLGIPHDIALRAGNFTFFSALNTALTMEQPAQITHARTLIARASRSKQWKTLVTMLHRPIFTGANTLESFERPVFLALDEVYVCPPHGLWIVGWTLDPFGIVKSMAVRCGARRATIDPKTWIAIPRPDVRDAFADKFGGLTTKCGFLAYLADVYVPGETPYVEVETVDGEVGFKPIAAIRSTGVDTIRDLLGRLDLRYDELVRGYDLVVGPAIQSINLFRLRNETHYVVMSFGDLPEQPISSIIVPLYGRIDFMEYQLAFFSRTLSCDHELIYVLDDPSQVRGTELLAASCFARFQHPFVLVVMAENLGYGPANNVGLEVARGEYICFLNSDVFPAEPNWLEYMLKTARTDPSIGIVGALLVFEDETTQHDGCSYERLSEFGDWFFCQHPNKGLLLEDRMGVHLVDGVTGACLLLSAEVARAVGGFDEGYVIGDFEDADLCEKVKALGQFCVVDRRARLYHLERQSQGNQQASWRFNLTLYNAWRFQRRWASDAVAASRLIPVGSPKPTRFMLESPACG
jgi:GT2 family glycosyltransferase